ncbi:MAG: LdpA C-terminal domain-containing domain, partial [Crocosphaera sp.]
VQLAGGTNHHTAPKLKELGLLQQTSSVKPSVAGIAYGSYARTLLSPFLETIDRLAMSSKTNDVPELFWQAVETAHSLVLPLKQVNGG